MILLPIDFVFLKSRGVKKKYVINDKQSFVSCIDKRASVFATPITVLCSSKRKSFSFPVYRGEGREQSPIDLKNPCLIEMAEIIFLYAPSPYVISNAATFTQVKLEKENFIIVDGIQYQLIQFHFHTPSEHFVDGVQYPMEIHFVHQSKTGALAVIGVLVVEGAENEHFDTMVAHIPLKGEAEKRVEESLNVFSLLPINKQAYRYSGSLTIPPFTENVKWIVLKDAIHLSQQQINKIFSIMGKNNRQLQNRFGRPVFLGIK